MLLVVVLMQKFAEIKPYFITIGIDEMSIMEKIRMAHKFLFKTSGIVDIAFLCVDVITTALE